MSLKGGGRSSASHDGSGLGLFYGLRRVKG